MFEFDHLLNGLFSKQYQQEIMQKARYDQAAQDSLSRPSHQSMASRLRAVLIAVINLLAQ